MIILDAILKYLKKLRRSKVIEVIIAIQVAILSIVVLAQVIFRYVLNHPLAWSEEMARFLLIWIVLLAAAVGVKRKSHFSVDILTKKFAERTNQLLSFALDIFLFILIFDVMVLNGMYLTKMTLRQISPALNIRVAYVYSSVLVGGILSCCYILDDLLSFIQKEIEKKRKDDRK